MRMKVAIGVPEAVRRIADWTVQEPNSALLVCQSPQYQRMQMALSQFTAAHARYEALQRRQEKFEAKLSGRSSSTTSGGFLGSSYSNSGNLSGAPDGGGISLTAVKFKRATLVTLPPTGPANDSSGVGLGISLVKWKRPAATGGAAAAPKAAPKAHAPAKVAAAPEPVEENEPEASSGGTDDEFFHGGIKKAAADALLLADGGESETGKFLIRSKGDSTTSYFVSVIYKGAPTHHALMREDEDSEFTLNKQPSGQTTLAGVIEHYGKKRPKWPVPLTTGVPAGGAQIKSKSTPAAVMEAPAEAAAAPSNGSSGGGGGNHPWLHNIKKPEAEELLLADGGEDATGKFLVRRKGKSENDFFISVIYKGKPTHHTLSREDDGAEFTLNKQPSGQTTLEDCVEHYRSKQPKWPVPLKDHVPA